MNDVLDPIPATASGHGGVDQWDSVFNDVASWSASNCAAAVPANLLKAHALYESGGNAEAVGSVAPPGIGLFQITSGAFRLAGGPWEYDFGGQDVPLLDPWWNAKIAAHDFLAPAIVAFPGDLDAVIASYNAGIGRVQQAIAAGQDLTAVTYAPWYVPSVRGAYAWLCGNSHRALNR